MTAIAHGLEAVEVAPSVVTVGNFDGVHRGHRTLLHRATHAAADAGVRSVAVTFDPHPAAVLHAGDEPARLQTLDDRIDALAATAVDVVLVIPFDHALAALSPADFIAHVLVERLRAVRVVVGANFRFGHRAAGDVVTLVEEGDRRGFTTEAVTLIEHQGTTISSTSIRAAIAAGDVTWATVALGRPFTLTGEVVRGDGRGRSIGVPTANLELPPGLAIPADGVYAGRARFDGETLEAVTNVGVRPTFGAGRRSVECHLLDGAPDLYGRSLTVSFEHRLRGERSFGSPEALVAQIRTDVTAARTWLAQATTPRGR